MSVGRRLRDGGVSWEASLGAHLEEGLSAESVDGGHHGGVEVDGGRLQPVVAFGACRIASGEQWDEPVVDLGGRFADCGGGLVDPGTDPVADLAGRGTGERHHQHRVDGDQALGDGADDEGGQGIGLAGAGAGFQEDAPPGNRPGEVEVIRHAVPSGGSVVVRAHVPASASAYRAAR